jgi:TPR repeat protein
MTAQARFASSPFAIPTLCMFLLCLTLPTAAKNDWQSDFRQWVLSSQTNPNCKILYTTGIYRSDLGDKPQWGFMSEKMFRWFSKEGVKLAPSVCPVTQKDMDKVKYRVLISETPMKTVSQTTHGSETRTTTEPFSADVSSHTTYSDGSAANTTATVQGQQTSTIVVPTETTVSQSSVALYMYAYRVKGNQLELISTDSVVFSRVTASGSGDDAATAELGAGVGNLIRASGDRHRADKLFEEALKAIRADVIVDASRRQAGVQNDLPENHAAERAPADMPQVAVPVTSAVPSAAPVRAQAPVSIDSAESAQGIATLKEQAASGDANAQWNLYLKYANEDGALHDNVQALVWLRKAAESGNLSAECELGAVYQLGQGASQDYVQAAVWFHKAAEQGDVDAQTFLGDLYAHGTGVPQDYAEAYFWFDLAAAGNATEQNSADTAKARDEAASHLSSAVMLRTQERARKWFEDHPAKPQ